MAQRAIKPMKNKPDHVEKTSSPAKVYHSRASKPSAVAKVTLADADATYGNEERDLINALKAKVNELIDALKK